MNGQYIVEFDYENIITLLLYDEEELWRYIDENKMERIREFCNKKPYGTVEDIEALCNIILPVTGNIFVNLMNDLIANLEISYYYNCQDPRILDGITYNIKEGVN